MTKLTEKEYLVRVLYEVRETGITNMFDRGGVAKVAALMGYDDMALTINSMDSNDYMSALIDMGELV